MKNFNKEFFACQECNLKEVFDYSKMNEKPYFTRNGEMFCYKHLIHRIEKDNFQQFVEKVIRTEFLTTEIMSQTIYFVEEKLRIIKEEIADFLQSSLIFQQKMQKFRELEFNTHAWLSREQLSFYRERHCAYFEAILTAYKIC